MFEKGSPGERDGLHKVLELPGDEAASVPFAGLLDALVHDTTGHVPELVPRERDSSHLICPGSGGLEDDLAGACMAFSLSCPSVVSIRLVSRHTMGNMERQGIGVAPISRPVFPDDRLGTVGERVEGVFAIVEVGRLVEIVDASLHVWYHWCRERHGGQIVHAWFGGARMVDFIVNTRCTSDESTGVGYRIALSEGG